MNKEIHKICSIQDDGISINKNKAGEWEQGVLPVEAVCF